MSRRRTRAVRRPARRSHTWKKLAAIALLAAAALAVSVAVFFASPWFANESGAPRAAIVDQLSLTVPNPAFVEEATATLEKAGYAVDYFPGEEVTVDFYRELPKHGFELIIFRVHAGQIKTLDESGEVISTSAAALFTSEPYSKWRHTEEQRELDLLTIAFYSARYAPEENFFAIMPEFVASSMRGDFDGAAVILMGCEVLTDTGLAQAFIDKGAGAVVGWDDTVSASHTDAATLNMLEHLVLEDLSLEAAAQLAASEIGPDPFYGSTLVSYPQSR